jgi:hypothetical protein
MTGVTAPPSGLLNHEHPLSTAPGRTPPDSDKISPAASAATTGTWRRLHTDLRECSQQPLPGSRCSGDQSSVLRPRPSSRMDLVVIAEHPPRHAGLGVRRLDRPHPAGLDRHDLVPVPVPVPVPGWIARALNPRDPSVPRAVALMLLAALRGCPMSPVDSSTSGGDQGSPRPMAQYANAYSIYCDQVPRFRPLACASQADTCGRRELRAATT